MSYEDPFEVLGVPSNVDQKSLKRAYGRLIRLHRPDKDPEGFQRVHGAYESALAMRKAADWFDAVPDLESEPAAATEASESRTPLSEADWQPLTSSTETPPVSERPAEEEDDDDWAETSRPEIDSEIELTPDFSVEELVRAHGDRGAMLLINDAVEDLVLDGHTTHVLNQLVGDAAQDLLVRAPELEFSILFVSAAIAYDEPERSAALLDVVALERNEYSWLEDRVAFALTYAEDFRKAKGHDLPPTWARLIRLLPIVAPSREESLLSEAVQHMRSQPARFVECFSALPQGMVHALGEHALPPDEVESDAELPPERALSDLLDRLEKELDADTENSLWTWAIVGSFVLCIAIWRMYGWKGAVAGVILVIVCLAVPQGGVDQRLYRKYVQMPLLRYVLQAGVSREHIIEAMRKRSATTDVRRFHHDVAGDDTLTLAHRLVMGLRVRKAARNATYVRPT